MNSKAFYFQVVPAVFALMVGLNGCGNREAPRAEAAQPPSTAVATKSGPDSSPVETSSADIFEVASGMPSSKSAAGAGAALSPTMGLLELGTAFSVDELSLTSDCGIGGCSRLDVSATSPSTDSLVLDSSEQVPLQ